MCYTYDSLSRVTARVVKNSGDNSVISTEQFSYDAAGNVTADSSNSEFVYDTNNHLTEYNGNTVSYDLDGNMWNNGVRSFTYDSANRLIYASGYTYTYNAEDVRIRNLCNTEDTTYTYDTNCKLSKLLCKTTNGVVTKYVYGRGLIGEEVGSTFKTYHFDCRGSTIAITDASGNISDTFAYDTYGKLISRTGTSEVIFGYNGRDGVVTDKNGLIYMRARYYSPEMKRFVNADIVAGQIFNAITLNRFAYANGNPVSFVDPFGLSVERSQDTSVASYDYNQAVLVSTREWGKGGLPIVGHTQLYLYDSISETWYCTEYTGPFKTVFDKNLAKVYWYKSNPPIFQDKENNKIDYVILDGDFNPCVEYLLENDLINSSLGGYNLLYNNCCDYTDDLLSKADIRGNLTEKYIYNKAADKESVDIPYIRAQAMQWCDKIDDTVHAIKEVIGEVKDTIVETAGEVKDAITETVNVIKETVNRIWDAITFWD